MQIHPAPGAVSHPQRTGGTIRTLSVSLIAVAAIATSLLVARTRQEKPTDDTLLANGQGPAVQELDAIRAAGL